jgi:hypothetical protein
MNNDFPRMDVSPQLRRKMTEVARVFGKEPTKSETILSSALEIIRIKFEDLRSHAKESTSPVLGEGLGEGE